MTAIQLIQLGLTLARGIADLVPGALEAKRTIDALLAEGRDPTEAEWAAITAAAEAAHARVQGG
jgi:hypothetical protein